MTNITMKRIYLFFTLLLIALPSMANTTPSVENDTTPMLDSVVATTLLEPNISKDNVIAQMNYCTNAVSNIIHNRSNSVLAYEADQLINNLTMEQACRIREIKDYRTKLLDKIGGFQITQEERQLMNRILSIKKDNLKWQALSSALNPTMLVTGGGKAGVQLAFQATLAAARTAVEYKTASNELEIEAMRAMWELRKRDIEAINGLRTEYMDIIFDMFKSYGLQEYDRLTEDAAKNLLTYISEPNPTKRIRILKDNQKYYTKYAPYYYYLGMAYVDNNEYHKAKPFFQKYLNLYCANPIFRHDNMSGCIALTTLTYEKNLTREQKIELINTVRNNLPHNSAAHLQCALAYIYELNEEEEGLKMLLSSIDDPFTSDREMLYLAIANLAQTINNYPILQSQIEECMDNESIIHLDNYLLYRINKQDNAWEDINKILQFEEVAKRQLKSGFVTKNFNYDLSLNIPNRFVMNENDCQVVIGNYIKGEFITNCFCLYNDNYITLEEINKVSCFKKLPELKYLYVEEVNRENHIFILREGNIEDIEGQKWPRQSEYRTNGKIGESDLKDIASFYKKHSPKSKECTPWKFHESNLIANMAISYYLPHVRIGIELLEKYLQEALYLCLNFDNNIQIVYKYNDEKKDLLPCYYQYNNRRVFASDEIEAEMYDVADTTAETLSNDSTKTIFKTITNWFRRDTIVTDTMPCIEEQESSMERVEIIEENIEEKDTTKNLFSTIKGWFKIDTLTNDTIQHIEKSINEVEVVEKNIEENDTTYSVLSTIKSWFK